MSRALLFILTIITISAAWSAHAQTAKIDSLRAIILKQQSDTTKVNLLNELSNEFFKSGNYDSVLDNSQRAAALANSINYKKGEGLAYIDLGWYYYTINNYTLAMRHALQAKRVYKEVKEKRGEGQSLLVMASIHIVQGAYDSSDFYINEALKIFEEAGYKHGIASAYTSMGTLYDMRGDYNTALKYYFEAINIYDEVNDKHGASLVYQSLAEYYRKQKEYGKAKLYLNKQLQYYRSTNNIPNIASAYIGLGSIVQDEKKYDSAHYYFNEALKIYERTNDKYSLGVVLNNLGDVYRLSKSYTKAISYYERSLNICYEINDIEGTIYPLDGMGYIYTQQGNYDKADDYLQKARKIAEALKIPFLLSDAYLHSSQLDSARKNYAMAYFWYKKHSQIKDSLQLQQNSKVVHEMQARFESEKKDQEIKFLNEENKLKEAQRQRERASFLIFLIISVLFIGALLYIVFQKIRTGKILNTQKTEISQKNEELNQMNEELKTVLETIEAQNQVLAEKNKKLEEVNQEKDGLIGIVAHDLRSPLTKTAGLVELISLSGPVTPQQQEMIDMIKKVCSDGNSLIKDLLEMNSIENKQEEETSYSVIDVATYSEAFVKHHQPIAAEKNIKITLEKYQEGKANILTNAEYLTRILDNLVSNAIKFSSPNTTIRFKTSTRNNQVFFSIQDEGPGISDDEKQFLFMKFKKLSARPTAGESSTGLGLSIVKTLVERLKGHINVESTRGKGSTFTIAFPMFNVEFADKEV